VIGIVWRAPVSEQLARVCVCVSACVSGRH